MHIDVMNIHVYGNARLIFYIHFRLWQWINYWNLSRVYGLQSDINCHIFFWTTVYIYTYSYPLCSEWVGHTSSEWGTRCRWTSDARPLKWTVVTTQSKCDSNWWSEMEKEDAGDLTKVPLTIIANNGKSWHPLFHAIDCRRQLFDGLI